MGKATVPIPVASADPQAFDIVSTTAARFQFWLCDEDGGNPSARGVGAASFVITRQTHAYTGTSVEPVVVEVPESDLDGGTLAAVPGATLKGVAFAGPASSMTIRATITDPAGRTHYRLHVDSPSR